MNKEIEELNEKIKNTEDQKELLNLRGRLIKVLKTEAKNQKNVQLKNSLELKVLEELKKHKENISNLKKEFKNNKASISDKLALKVKEIATTIEIFMRKNDILERIKNGAVSGVISALFASSISLGVALISGAPITLPLLASLIPTASYLGLSSLISGSLNETVKSKLYKKYEKLPEEIPKMEKFSKEYITDNKVFIETLLKEEKEKDIIKQIENEKILINEYARIIENAPNDDMKQVLILEKIDVMKKLEYNYALLENNYLAERLSITSDDYKKITADKNKLLFDMKKDEMFFKEVTENLAKKIGKTTAISYACRMALSTIFPSLQFTSVTDALTPFLYTALGNLCTSGKIKESIKMKKIDFTREVIKLSHPELFEEELNNQKTAVQAL